MAYRIAPDESAQVALQRIAHRQIDRALAEIEDAALDLHRTVHQVRKRGKKLRGLLRLARPGLGEPRYRCENAAFRDAARRLAPLRDAESLRACVRDLLAHYRAAVDREAFAPLLGMLRARRDGAAGDAQERLERVVADLRAARARVDGWRLEDGDAALVGGATKTYARARKAMSAAAREPGAAQLHEWRKRVKYGMYHLRLLRTAWPQPLRGREKALHALADRLGDHHDLALLRAALGEEPLRREAGTLEAPLRALAARRQGELAREAYRLGRPLYAHSRKRHARELEEALAAWRAGATPRPVVPWPPGEPARLGAAGTAR